ncbi:hypothetical protein GCM10009558_086600 [Virgisporangium aurantiacum]
MRRLLLPVLTLLALAACGSDPDPTVAPPAGSPAASVTATASAPDVPTENWNDPQPADAAGTSYPACAVPAIFDLADKWTARAVPADAAKLLGPHTLACEIDGKAAGVIGFIRVFRATGTDIRAALLAQVGDKAAGLRTREFTAAPGPGRDGDGDRPLVRPRRRRAHGRAARVPARTGLVRQTRRIRAGPVARGRIPWGESPRLENQEYQAPVGRP